MYALLQRLRVGKRLFLGYGLLIALMSVISITSLLSFKRTDRAFDAVAIEGNARIRYATQVLVENNVVINYIQAMLISRDAEHLDRAHEQYLAANTRFQTAYDHLAALPADADTAPLLAAIRQAKDDVTPHTQQVNELILADERDLATVVLSDDAMPGLLALDMAIKGLMGHEQKKLMAAVAQADATSRNAKLTVLVMMVLSLLAAVALGTATTRSLTRPLARATAAARDLAAGRLQGPVLEGGQDEVGDVLRAIQQTRQAVTGLKDGLEEMARQHDAGIVSHLTDTRLLQGEYRALGEAINALVRSHVEAAELAGELASGYARGDMRRDFPRVPGEKQVLMHAMDDVKTTIGQISQQILQMSQAAVRGDFSVRGDEERFEYGFREMVANLNQLMATAQGSLGDVSDVLRSIADGDLTVRMDGDYQGVFAQMRDDANTTVANLTVIIERIQAAAGQIRTAAGEIASGNQDLSQRTELQAANLEETAASMEELTSTVRQNAEHARQANQLAIGAHQVASQGGEVTRQVVDTMGQIEQSSRRIGDIISVIDGIAFQTNILALNAAVEAARAGEQGRGFAVVATEVRSLAQRSAAAAKEIKGLIDDSMDKVSTGSRLVNDAGSTMSEIVTSVQRVTDIMADISAASQEQTAGIEQVGQTVVQMDEATQQNAALVEEASAAARAMEDQAIQLAQAVAVFRLAR